jgi:hypothetical protein
MPVAIEATGARFLIIQGVVVVAGGVAGTAGVASGTVDVVAGTFADGAGTTGGATVVEVWLVRMGGFVVGE